MNEYEESLGEDEDAWAESYDEAEDDDAEFFDPVTMGLGMAAQRGFPPRRPAIERSRPRGSATSGVQGRQYGIVHTPQGDARVELPGRFPTLNEFKQTVARLQSDIKANSTGIAQLTQRVKQDVQLEAAARAKSDRALRKTLKRTQWAALIAIAVPLAMEAARDPGARAFAK